MPSAARSFEEQEAHFESAIILTLCWLPPAEDAARAEAWLYEGASAPVSMATRCCADSSIAPGACCN
jgi:hypothetical protein